MRCINLRLTYLCGLQASTYQAKEVLEIIIFRTSLYRADPFRSPCVVNKGLKHVLFVLRLNLVLC